MACHWPSNWRQRTYGSLSVEQIHERLDDSIGLLVGGARTAPSRQRALRATLDWSYRLLDETERAVFRRLAVFAEGCDLEAIEAVCPAGDIAPTEILEVAMRLIDKSLVVVQQRDGRARYRLLEPIRQYSNELLRASGERDAVRRRHARHYQAFAEARAFEPNFGGPRRFTAMNEEGLEYANLRTALAWSVENAEPQVGLNIAWSLLFFWQHHGSVTEGIQWVTRLLALPGAAERTYARAGALLSACYLLILRGEHGMARSFAEEASSIGRELAEPLLEWNGLFYLGVASYSRGDLTSAWTNIQQAAARAHAVSAAVPEATCFIMLGMILCDQADYATAEPFAEQANRLGRIDPWFRGWLLLLRSRVAFGLGAVERARASLEEALATARQNGDPHSLTPLILEGLGELEIVCNRPHEAREWLVTSLELRHDSGEHSRLAQSFDRLASLDARCSDPERALKLVGAADRLYHQLGAQRAPSETQKLERWLLPLRDQIGAQAAETATAEGRALELDDAVAFALSNPGESRPSAPAPSASPLTAREQEVATLLARGLSNRQIADELVISLHTAQRHVENILSKLAFSSRTQVAAWAINEGFTADLRRP
jgi:predicted ATPase/DNA-binding CsgD family transcriptional regulator